MEKQVKELPLEFYRKVEECRMNPGRIVLISNEVANRISEIPKYMKSMRFDVEEGWFIVFIEREGIYLEYTRG